MKVWGDFLGEFATDMAFVDFSEAVRHEMLESAIARIAFQMFGQDVV